MAKEKFREKIVEFEVVNKKKIQPLNESAQLGDKVIYKGQRGFIIGQAQNGDWLVQIQGSSDFVNPKDVKVVGIKAKTMEMPMKFDEKTQKLLFEQFVKCGIYMGNTPVKTNGCVVKFSDWNGADDDKPIGVIVEGRSTVLPKKQIRILEDINSFADPTPYAWGIYTDQSGESEDVLVNSLEFADSYADAQGVTIIRNIDTTPTAVQVPKDSIQPNLNRKETEESEAIEPTIEPIDHPDDDMIADRYQ